MQWRLQLLLPPYKSDHLVALHRTDEVINDINARERRRLLRLQELEAKSRSREFSDPKSNFSDKTTETEPVAATHEDNASNLTYEISPAPRSTLPAIFSIRYSAHSDMTAMINTALQGVAEKIDSLHYPRQEGAETDGAVNEMPFDDEELFSSANDDYLYRSRQPVTNLPSAQHQYHHRPYGGRQYIYEDYVDREGEQLAQEQDEALEELREWRIKLMKQLQPSSDVNNMSDGNDAEDVS